MRCIKRYEYLGYWVNKSWFLSPGEEKETIAVVRNRRSTTSLSISEIGYRLSFERPLLFSKLFKAKTSLSPLAFRASFN